MEQKIIPDDLLRQIIGVGQVDVLVGLATCNHVDTVGNVIRAVRSLLYTSYPRLRVALLHLDQASNDGTPLAACRAWDEDGRSRGTQGLRTTHYMASPAEPEPEGDVARVLLAAADLLQARAVLVLDADVEPEGTTDMAALLAPVWDGGVDVVAPAYARGPADGLLVTQLVRPLTLAIYARRLAEPLMQTFACSGRFATHCTQVGWSTIPEQRATHYWIATEALVGPFQVHQYACGLRRVHHGRPQPPLADVFATLVTSVFSCIEAHAQVWLTRENVEDLPSTRAQHVLEDPQIPGDTSGLLQSFAEDISNLEEVFRSILAPDTLAAIQAASREPTGAHFPDALWAAAVGDFLGAYHHGVMRRDHIALALMPLYRARVGAFLRAQAHESAAAVAEALESIGVSFEAARLRIVQQWTHKHEVEHG